MGESCHAKKIDPELNNTCQKITGTLRPTPLSSVYRLAGIAAPHICRESMTRTQKTQARERSMSHLLWPCPTKKQA